MSEVIEKCAWTKAQAFEISRLQHVTFGLRGARPTLLRVSSLNCNQRVKFSPANSSNHPIETEARNNPRSACVPSLPLELSRINFPFFLILNLILPLIGNSFPALTVPIIKQI